MEYVSIAQNNKRARWIIAVCVVVCTTAVLVGFPLLLGVVPAGAHTVASAALRVAALQRTNALKTVTVPDPSTFNVFIRPDTCSPQPRGRAALHILGQACASCSFQASTDNRSKNQPDPGLRNQTLGVVTSACTDSTGFGPNLHGFGPNYQWSLRDFPFHHVLNPDVSPELDPAHSSVISDTNDIASSQGVFNASESPPCLQFSPVTGCGARDTCDALGELPRSTHTMIAGLSVNADGDGHVRIWISRS